MNDARVAVFVQLWFGTVAVINRSCWDGPYTEDLCCLALHDVLHGCGYTAKG